MRFYQRLDRLGWPKSYAGKLFVACGVGVWLPPLALLAYGLTTGTLQALSVPLLVSAGAAALGTAVALVGLHALLSPLRAASAAIRVYLASGTVPALPTLGRDMMGRLLADVQEAIVRLDAARDAARAATDRTRAEHRHRLAAVSRLGRDLKAPLHALLELSEAVQCEAAASFGRHAEALRIHGTDLAELIETVLVLTEDDRDTGTIGAVAVDVGPIVRRAVALKHGEAQAGGIRLVDLVDLQMPPVVAEPRALKQALSHLLSDTIASAPAGRVVALSARTEADAVTIACTQTTPSGAGAGETPGYPDASRGPMPARPPGGPAADDLRLALVHALVRMAGGTLEVGVWSNQGRIASIRLPLAAAGTTAGGTPPSRS